MEIVDILTREIETMRKMGRDQKEIDSHVDRVIAAHNLRILERLKMEERVTVALS